MFGSALLTLTTLTAVVSAATNFTTCCTVDPTTVTNTDRQNWCRAQTNTCPYFCRGQTSVNTCDPTTLTYNCTCLSGPPTANLSDYDQTLSSFQCANWRDQCTAAHPNDASGINFCQSFTCGKQNATLYSQNQGVASSSAGGASTTGTSGTSGAVASATNSVASISASRSAAGAAATAAVQLGKQYGTAALGVAGMAIFGLAL